MTDCAEYLLFLDASGSMAEFKAETLAAFNAHLVKLREEDVHVSIVTFNSKSRILRWRENSFNLDPLEPGEYVPCSTTATYDAVGEHLTSLSRQIQGPALVTIFSDGRENSSQSWDAHRLASLVQELTRDGWTFTYVGANQDLSEVSEDLFIPNTLEFAPTSQGIMEAVARIERSTDSFLREQRRGTKTSLAGLFEADTK